MRNRALRDFRLIVQVRYALEQSIAAVGPREKEEGRREVEAGKFARVEYNIGKIAKTKNP